MKTISPIMRDVRLQLALQEGDPTHVFFANGLASTELYDDQENIVGSFFGPQCRNNAIACGLNLQFRRFMIIHGNKSEIIDTSEIPVS